jgi:hypothetical protein
MEPISGCIAVVPGAVAACRRSAAQPHGIHEILYFEAGSDV